MKLYTEEQVKVAMKLYNETSYEYADVFEKLTPIELPSDEEVDEWVAKNDYSISCVDINTTKWVIEQIKQQDK